MDPWTQQPTRCDHSPLPTLRYLKFRCWRALNQANLSDPQEETYHLFSKYLSSKIKRFLASIQESGNSPSGQTGRS
ncbi:hypothetical protein R6Q59_005524 [Mikania micrantha]